MKEYTKPKFDREPIPVYLDGGINYTKIKGLCQEMTKESFISGKEEVNWNHNPHVTPPSSISLNQKRPDLLDLSDYKKFYLFVKAFFKETRETFPLSKIFFGKMGKVKRFNDPKHSQGLFYKLCGDSLGQS